MDTQEGKYFDVLLKYSCLTANDFIEHVQLSVTSVWIYCYKNVYQWALWLL